MKDLSKLDELVERTYSEPRLAAIAALRVADEADHGTPAEAYMLRRAEVCALLAIERQMDVIVGVLNHLEVTVREGFGRG